MTLKVLKPFRDKVTGAAYNVSDLVEFTEERAAEILADRRKLAEAVEEKQTEAEAKEDKPTEKPTAEKSTKKRSR